MYICIYNYICIIVYVCICMFNDLQKCLLLCLFLWFLTDWPNNILYCSSNVYDQMTVFQQTEEIMWQSKQF